MNYLHKFYKFLGNYLIRFIIITGLFIVPVVALLYKFNYPKVQNSNIFLVFIGILVIERIWETFYSSKERKGHKLYGDWTLPVVSLFYIILVIGVIWEFYTINRPLNVNVTLSGVILFIFSFLLRIYCIRILKNQWSVHAVGAKKVKDVCLINVGPYKYIRHPIYLGVIIEVISIPTIWNTYYMCFFACMINVPLQIIRAYLEEKHTVRKLGGDYLLYKKVVPAFLPIKLFKN